MIRNIAFISWSIIKKKNPQEQQNLPEIALQHVGKLNTVFGLEKKKFCSYQYCGRLIEKNVLSSFRLLEKLGGSFSLRHRIDLCWDFFFFIRSCAISIYSKRSCLPSGGHGDTCWPHLSGTMRTSCGNGRFWYLGMHAWACLSWQMWSQKILFVKSSEQP